MQTKWAESEEDTKVRRITPALKAVGWPEHAIWMEYSLRSDRFRIVPDTNETRKVPPKGRNKPDYLLCRNTSCPLAVIEAKKASLHAEDGIDQAKAYAEQLDIPFAYASAGEKFIELNLKTGVQRELAMEDFPSPDALWKMWCAVRRVKPQDEPKMASAQYYSSDDGKIPRYYQMTAINRVVNAVIADKRRRALLVMATGTGKTYVAFQIVWRLVKAGVVKNVLYLADRNQLVDQTIVGDFAPFEKLITKIKGGEIDNSHQIYFGLYQQLKSADDGEKDESGVSLADRFRQVPPDFFDLIVVDECHRGSAKEESSWREILEYFTSAVQIGLTATPNKKDGADNAEYFGKPLYTYTLKQGIEDGFLAPFRVVRVSFNKDRDGWEPEDGELDDFGKPIPKKRYTLDDFDRTLILRDRINAVAQRVTDYLHHIGRMSKTIVFCMTQEHAGRMRDAIRACNADMMARNSNYAVRMTSDDEDGKRLYAEFTSINEPYPVVVTTSKLLTTGADTKCVKLIVLDAPIRSMTEFKQIIGRGTRLQADAGKTFFTILDFRGVCELFQDSEFDGPAEQEAEWGDGDPIPKEKPSKKADDDDSKTSEEPTPPEPTPPTPEPSSEVPRETYVVSGVEVSVVGETVSYLDEDGKLVTAKFRDYTRKGVLDLFGSEAGFLEVWNGAQEKSEILEQLEQHGILFEHLRKELKNPDYDEFDLICAVAFGHVPLTRAQRASRAQRSKFLDKYQGAAREILETLLDIYAHEGVREVGDVAVLRSEEFHRFGGPRKVVRLFGNPADYRQAITDLENALYRPASGSDQTTPNTAES